VRYYRSLREIGDLDLMAVGNLHENVLALVSPKCRHPLEDWRIALQSSASYLLLMVQASTPCSILREGAGSKFVS
jgi:hypothetical protein